MLIVDANVLLYATDDEAREHEVANKWMEEALGGREAVAFPWIVLLAYLRVATNPAVYTNPLEPARAAGDVEKWLSHKPATVIEPMARHLGLLSGLLAATGTAGNLVNDAHLAALALEHNATVVSFDRDFGRFEGLNWRLPV